MVVVLLGIGALTLITPGVAAAAPNAALTMAPSSPEAGQEVTFTDASTDDAAMIVGYEWAVDGDPLGYERTFSHRFDTAGDHEVTLTVVDAREESDSTTVRVEVNEAPSERVRAGEVEARLYYTDSERGFQPMRLQVLRGSRVNYAQIVRPRCRGECPVYPRGGYGRGRSLQAADVTRDDDPEIVFDFGWGNICCRATTVLEFDPGLGRYRARTHNWGEWVSI